MDLPACFYRVSVKALILDEEGRFLLCREDNGGWDLPGGGLDHGEEPHEGLRREVHEETGLVLSWIDPQPICFVTARNPHHVPFCNVIYPATLAHLNFVPSAECQELRFVDKTEACHLRLFPNVEAFVRVWDGPEK